MAQQMTRRQVQNDAIEMLAVFEENIPKTTYSALRKAIDNDKIATVYAMMNLNAWIRATQFSLAAETLYQHFIRHRNLWEKEEVEEKEKETDQGHVEGFKTVYVTTLPVYKGSDDQHHRHSSKPLHLKTNWDVTKDHLMYHLEFRGHLYTISEIIFAVAVGYIYNSEKKLRNTKVHHVCDGAVVTSYTAKDNKVVFKLQSKNNSNWHASDLTINMIGNGDWYHQEAWKKGLEIVDSMHSDDNF